jgi:PEP-CTERM motif
MGIRFRAAGIATVVLLAFLLLPSARADSFNFTFTGNQTWCASYLSSCADFGSGTFTTNPLTFSPLYNPAAYPVTSIAGSLDGIFPPTMVSGYYVGAIPGPGTAISYNSGPINFIANGQEWALTRVDQGPWQDFLYSYGAGSWEPINLTITAPEPSTLLFLSIGLLGVMGLTLLKNRLS